MNKIYVNHLKWLYDRMLYVHNENELYDYMIKFKFIIDDLEKNKLYEDGYNDGWNDCIDGYNYKL